MRTTKVMTAPTSTTNITGFLIIMRGFSFQKESTIALRSIFLSASELLFAWGAGVIGSSKTLSGIHQQMFQNRAKAQGREEGERAHDKDDADEQYGEQRPGDWKSTQRFRDMFLRRQVSRYRQNRNDSEEASKQHRKPGGHEIPRRGRV